MWFTFSAIYFLVPNICDICWVIRLIMYVHLTALYFFFFSEPVKPSEIFVKFRTWQDGRAVVVCANIPWDLVASNKMKAMQIFHWIRFVNQNTPPMQLIQCIIPSSGKIRLVFSSCSCMILLTKHVLRPLKNALRVNNYQRRSFLNEANLRLIRD